MVKSKIIVPIAATLLYLIPMLALSCASRERIVSGAFESLTVIRDAFVKYDEQKQTELVATAADHDSGHKALEDYRAKRDKVKVAIVTAYGALTVANVDGSDASLKAAVDAVKMVVQAYGELP